MNRTSSEDLLFIQMRLFHYFQLQENISVEETEKIFRKYDMFNYIKTCYEEYHVQGDEANLYDIKCYLQRKGWRK